MMEVIKSSILNEQEVDEMAKRIFLEAIEIAGGFRKVVHLRNLTWVPSLIAASYAVILKYEFLYPTSKIAAFLGLSVGSVENMLSANEREILKYLGGELIKVDEHKAGGLAKLAYKKLKSERRLKILELDEAVLEEIKELAWPILVLHALKGCSFPLDKNTFMQKLDGVKIGEKSASEIADAIAFPISSPAELLKKIKAVL